jgi:ribosomal protein S18 acetylase RimI-like enzyme
MAVIDLWAERAGVACLDFLARSDDPTTIISAERAGFHLTDVRLTYRYAHNHAVKPDINHSESPARIRGACRDDLATLQRIAGESHRDSRFYFDENFPRAGCDALYETWIRRSCEGYADGVLVAELYDRPAGYLTCHLPRATGEPGNIGLVGVDSVARGLGLGRALVLSALGWFTAHRVEGVTVVTQVRNLAAQSLYQRCGFVTCAAQLWYHKWYRIPARTDDVRSGSEA